LARVGYGEQAAAILKEVNKGILELERLVALSQGGDDKGSAPQGLIASLVRAGPGTNTGRYASHLQGREYTVAFILNTSETCGITLLGPDCKGWLFPRQIMVDSGAEINAIIRSLAKKMGLRLSKCQVVMVIFGGKTCVITEVAKDVPWVFFKGTTHAITLLVDLFIMEGSDSYGILMGQKLIMHPALSAVLQGFLSSLCVFPELATNELEAVRTLGQAGWGRMYEIPVDTYKQYSTSSVRLLSDGGEYKG
jgi:hypothetical protein